SCPPRGAASRSSRRRTSRRSTRRWRGRWRRLSRTSGNLEIWKSGNLEIWKSGDRARAARRIRLGILLGACLIPAACPGGCDASKLLNPTGVHSVTVAPALVQLTVDQTQQFTATVLPNSVSDKSVTWSVAPSGTATIDGKGMLKALAPGQAVVTATTVATPTHTGQAAVNITAAAVRWSQTG